MTLFYLYYLYVILYPAVIDYSETEKSTPEIFLFLS